MGQIYRINQSDLLTSVPKDVEAEKVRLNNLKVLFKNR